jgi:hypothetical protein
MVGWRMVWLADGLAGGGVCCGVWPPPTAGSWADRFASELSGCGALCAAQKVTVIEINKINRQTSAKWLGLKLILAPTLS